LTTPSSFGLLNHLPPRVLEERGLARRRSHLGAAFSAPPSTDDQTSDAPCRPSPSPGRARLFRRAEDRFPRSCVNKSGFPGPRAPLIDTCSAYFRRQRPPPISRLCRRDPASDARSPLRCSRTKGLDPPRLRGQLARGREDRTPRVDFCNQNDRRAQPLDRSNPAHHAQGRPSAELRTSLPKPLAQPRKACRTGG
jgi:hypothetical protein